MTENIHKFKTTPDDQGQRIDKWIYNKLNKTEISRTRVKKLILSGYLKKDNKKHCDPAGLIKSNQIYEICFPKLTKADPKPEKIKLKIIYEDKDLICLDKPSGMVVHPAPGNQDGTLVNALLYYCPDELIGIGGVNRPGIVHRLDKDTSGIMIVAKSDRSHLKLSEMFEKHELERKYYALIWGIPIKKNDILQTFISRDTKNRKKFCVSSKGKIAITEYKVIEEYYPFASLIECKLRTGRTHQIRVHLSYLGHGIIGDQIYGKGKKLKQMENNKLKEILRKLKIFKRQALHSRSLKFKHPISNKEINLISEMPKDINNLIYLLKSVKTL